MTTDVKKEKTWIVLMDRVPRGPYTAAEINGYIERHLIRSTDLAYIVSEDPRAHHEWKFLWQFEEFDRRKSPEGQVPVGGTQRQKLTPEQIRGKVLSQLPGEIAKASRDEIFRQSKREVASSAPARGQTASGGPVPWWKIALPATSLSLAYFLFTGLRPKPTGNDGRIAEPVAAESHAPSASVPQRPSGRPEPMPMPAAPAREVSGGSAAESPTPVETEAEQREPDVDRTEESATPDSPDNVDKPRESEEAPAPENGEQ